MKNDFKFDKWLREQLDERGWKSSDIAREAGITRACVSLYMLGERYPSLSTFLLILDAFNKKLTLVDMEDV